jgi:hypothetical protein
MAHLWVSLFGVLVMHQAASFDASALDALALQPFGQPAEAGVQVRQ